MLIGISFLVVTEGSPYVSGVISRFEKENMRKGSQHFTDVDGGNERVWHYESNEQLGSTSHQRNTHRRPNEQRFGTNTESHSDFTHQHSSHNSHHRDDSYFLNDDDERPHWV